MPARSRSVGAAKRHTPVGVAANNATGFWVYTVATSLTGDPYNPGGEGAIARMTDAKLLEWVNQRKLKGWLESGITQEFIRGSDRYTSDGTLPLTPETSVRSWYQQALKNQWGVPANTKSWFQRTTELGVETAVLGNSAVNSVTGTGYQIHFNANWHDNVSWGASTVAGALTPVAGTMLADYTARCKAVKAAGFIGDGLDFETNTSDNFSHPYQGMPVGQTEQQTRNLVMLRAMQMATIAATHLNVTGGPTFTGYYVRSTGSLDELQYYITNNGAVTANVFDYVTTDSFLAGWACVAGIKAVYLADAWYYREAHIIGDDTANDDYVTAWANSVSFDQSRRFARFAQLLADNTTLSDAQRLEAMRKLYHCMFIWLTDNLEGGPGAAAEPQDLVEAYRLVRESVKWSMGRRIYLYVRGDLIKELEWYNQFDQFESAFATYMVDGVADAVNPVCAITSPTTSPTYSTTTASVVLSGTATDNMAIWRVEWANAANGTSGPCTTTWVNDSGSNWNPLDATKLPRRTSLGRIQWHITWTATVPLNAGSNLITVTAYDTHGNSASTSIAVTTSLLLSDAFTGTDGSAPGVQWGTVVKSTGATVDINSNQLRMVGGTLGSFLDYQYLPSTLTATHFTTLVTGTIPAPSTPEQFGHIGFRGSGTRDTTAGFGAVQTTGYWVEIDTVNNQLHLIRRTGGTSTTLATVAVNWADGDTFYIKTTAIGTSLKVRVWRNAESEPGTWQIDTTDATYSSGNVWLGHTGGPDTTADTIRFDSIVVNSETEPPPSGSYLDPPTAGAISGMSSTVFKEWDWTGATPFADWYRYDGAGNANGERSVPRPANATVVTGEASTTGSAYLRLIVRRETYAGYPLTGVQMEAAGTLVGNGSPFYVEVRLRWTGYLGFWGGPWLLQYPGTPREVDVMETVNLRPPWVTMHSPEVATQAYAASNDGGWHRYGIRFTSTTITFYFDNVLVPGMTVNNASTALAFVQAAMFPKIQHLAGGNFPNSDNGSTIPDASLPTSDKYFDVDYYRIYK